MQAAESTVTVTVTVTVMMISKNHKEWSTSEL